MNRRYTWWQGVNYVVIGAIVAGVIIPSMEVLRDYESYRLSATTKQLTGHPDAKLSSQLSYDKATKTYSFNKAAVKAGDAPQDVLKNKVGASNEKGGSLYALDVPADMSRGVTYHDVNSQLEFTLVPEFASREGRIKDGHLVYPMDQGLQGVYTLKNNGLKEDIIVTQATQDTMRFAYHLKLPGSLEARMTADGGVGIYSGDPALFGDVSYGSEADRAQVEQARNNGEKNHLVFGLPAPVITAPGKQTPGQAAAHFELQGTELVLVAEHLLSAKTTISIDPSVVVTSTSDFQTRGNDEGMIDFGTSGQITRRGLTGGTIGSWSSTTSFTTARSSGGVVAYNGYLYLIGGDSGSNTAITDVQYVPINSNGTLGTWATTTALPAARMSFTAVAYNGYIYLAGGSISSTPYGDVLYAAINSNGTLGSWNTGASFTTARHGAGLAAYNGYLYLSGGYDGSNGLSDTQYASIKADGSIGSWSSTTSFTTGRRVHGFVINNGYMYVVGGDTGNGSSGATQRNDVQYAKINDNGTVGTWMTTTSFTNVRSAHSTVVYQGYLYIMGGYNSSFVNQSDVQYAQINANGSLGSWATTTSMATARFGMRAFAYNGNVYYVGGSNSSATRYSEVYYSAIDPAGRPTAFGTLTNDFSTARALSCSVAYNGYLYNIGGSTTDSGSNNSTVVQYTALDSSTGNNGSWSSTTSLPAARGSSGCVAHNGYLYVVGGYTGSGSPSTAVLYIAINSNGTLGASWTTGTSLPGNAIRGGVFTYGTSSGPYIYVLSDGAVHTAVYAPLNVSTGAVGSWTDGNNVINTYGSRGYAQVGKYLYAFGGYNSGTAQSAVEYTSINNDGTLNAWASTTGLNTAIGYTNGTTVNGCIYSVGGESSGGTSIATVQYACPAANGTISAWYNAPNLTVATTDLGVTSYNGYLYGVGGYTTSVQTTTQFAYVNNGGSGSNGTWGVTANALTGDRSYPSAAAYNGYLYVVGGDGGGGTNTNSVQYSQISASGNTGAFATDGNTFTNIRQSHSTVAYNGYLYVIGGLDGSTRYGDTQYAPIGSSGALSGSFASSTSFVTGTGSDTGRAATCAVAYNGYMYVTGGVDTSAKHADTRYAPINSNGTLGTWADSGNNFTTARMYHSCFVANGYLYVLGGGTGSANLNDVQAAPINSNGTLGAWAYTSSFDGVRETAIAGYSNGFAYIYGGCSNTACTTSLGDTQFAPVYANGTLGAWQRTTTSVDGGSATKAEGSGVVYNGYLYTFGGSGGLSYSTNYYSPLSSTIPRTARYSKLIDLGNPVSVSSIAYNGALPTSTVMPGVAPVYFRAAGTDGVFGSVTASSAITAGATPCLATSQANVRYLEVTIVLDDARMGIFADSNGTAAYVTDFTVNSITPHPASNIRLKLGRTLQSGTTLAPVDTCAP